MKYKHKVTYMTVFMSFESQQGLYFRLILTQICSNSSG